MINTLTTKHLILSPPNLKDLSEIIHFDDRNLIHLKKWEPTSSLDTPPVDQKTRLSNWIKECADGKSVRFIIRPKNDPNKIIGFCNFTQIFYGSFKACYLGYKIDYEYEGKGLMFEALEASIKYVFENSGIHRIMANYIPMNARSAKLLHRLGFIVEGYAKNYLLINGKWEDHVLTALSLEQAANFLSKKVLQPDYENQVIENLIYREIELTDTPFIMSLMEQLGYPLPYEIMKENIQQYILSPNLKALVTEESGLVVGCVAVAITHYFHRPKSFIRVIAMVVDERKRRSGIGKNLIKLAEKYGVEQGCSQIELTSAMHREKLGAHDFYRSLGYVDLNNTKKYFSKKLIEEK